MWRHLTKPRDDWRRLVESQGLAFPVTVIPSVDGGKPTELPYWTEDAWYELDLAEVELMESATETLYGMCLEAGRFMASGEFATDAELGLTAGSLELVRESLARKDPSVYGRFDLVFDGTDVPKMLELNGDTPTGLLETGVIQWAWLEDVMPDGDQWNSVHDRLVQWWTEQRVAGRFQKGVHFFHSAAEPSGEEEMTVVYMRDCAVQAGLVTFGHDIEGLGWDEDNKEFVDYGGEQVHAAFKLYPWEDMLRESFGTHLLKREEPTPVQWIEPAWKAMLSTKALLAALWQLYPGHENLLPSFMGKPGSLREWVAKPLHGREGDGIRIHTADVEHAQGGHYGREGYVYQQWAPLPSYDGNRAVIGSWVIDGRAAGMMVRESDGPITDNYSRFVPHALGSSARPSTEQVQTWLRT